MPLPTPLLKGKGRKLNLFTVQELSDLLTEQISIQRVDMLQIQFTVRTQGNLITVKIIIVQAHQNRLFTVDTQLGCQSIGRGGFSGRTGTCQHNHFCLALTDQISHLGIAFFVQSFINSNEFTNPTALHQQIQISCGFTLHQLTPAFTFIKNAQEMGHMLIVPYLLRVLVIRE